MLCKYEFLKLSIGAAIGLIIKYKKWKFSGTFSNGYITGVKYNHPDKIIFIVNFVSLNLALKMQSIKPRPNEKI